MSENGTKVDRRTFLNTAAGVVAGSAIATTALSYDRILGANDRISLGHIGIGSRGSGLHTMMSQLKESHNVETTAVCDLWTRNRERAAANTEKYYGRAPRASNISRSSSHSRTWTPSSSRRPSTPTRPVLKAVAEAGKDAYCEKPMGNVLAEVKAARDAVKQRKLVVQIGTQHRSEPYQLAAREVLRSRARSATSASSRSSGTTTGRAGAAARK